jgi:hypothetical protein
MSDTSELGPIDPQIILADGKGNRMRHSIQAHLDAYNEHVESLKADPENAAARIMLDKFDPAVIKVFQGAMKRARQIAEALLKQGMFRDGGNWSQATSALLDTDRWPSHGQPISWRDATHEDLGLSVDYLKPTSREWRLYWQLYCLQRLVISEEGDKQKLFESDYASLLIEGRVLIEGAVLSRS